MKVLIVTVLLITACGSDPCNDADEKTKCEASEVAATNLESVEESVEFSGYVQRAFELTVEGKQFQDTEHFYTNFIGDLVYPKYPELKDKEVRLLGEYALDRFGSHTEVYLSSDADEGHLFQTATNKQGRFSVTVEPKALDETFRARIVIRIGLIVDDEEFCYLLKSTKDGILVSDSAKPIIFNDFVTQLNTYKCGVSDGIVVPEYDQNGVVIEPTKEEVQIEIEGKAVFFNECEHSYMQRSHTWMDENDDDKRSDAETSTVTEWECLQRPKDFYNRNELESLMNEVKTAIRKSESNRIGHIDVLTTVCYSGMLIRQVGITDTVIDYDKTFCAPIWDEYGGEKLKTLDELTAPIVEEVK